MANKKHLDVLQQSLQQGPEIWSEWRRQADPDLVPDLQGASFAETNLQGFDFKKVDLKGADFREADLQGVDFQEARLDGATFQKADLKFATLESARLISTNMERANLWGANLQRSYLRHANLKRANAWGADLSDAHVQESYLQHCNLQGSDLRRAYFWRVDMRRVFLRGADLRRTHIQRTDLRKADLREADLRRTHLRDITLQDSDLSGAKLGATVITDVDLRQTKGLQKVDHLAPSPITIDTLYRSQGKFTDAFLRGAGVPETFIINTRGMFGKPIEYAPCFILYSEPDAALVMQLADQMQTRGVRCWLDKRSLLPDDDADEHVERDIRLWDRIIICCSESSLTSWWINSEIDKATDKEKELLSDHGHNGQILVPISIDDYLFRGSTASDHERRVRQRLAADFSGWTRDHKKLVEQFELLLRALRL